MSHLTLKGRIRDFCLVLPLEASATKDQCVQGTKWLRQLLAIY